MLGTILGIAMGVVLTYCKKRWQWLFRIYVDIMRGLPVLVTIFVVYYFVNAVLKMFFGFQMQQNTAGAVSTEHLVRNRGTVQRNLNHVFLCVFDSLADGIRNFAGFSDTKADIAVAVADNNQRGKFKDAAALNRFGNAVNGNNALFHFSCGSVITSRQSLLLLHQNLRPPSRAPSASSLTRP